MPPLHASLAAQLDLGCLVPLAFCALIAEDSLAFLSQLTFNDTQTLFRDFFIIPGYINMQLFQDLWHANQLGVDHDEYVNWLSFREFNLLLAAVSAQVASDDQPTAKLGKLLAGMEKGTSKMQKRGATFLPRFHAVTYH